MKRSQLLFVAALFALTTTVITAPGCNSTAQDRVETLNTAVDFYANQSEQIDQDLEGLRATLAELEGLGADAEAAGDDATIARVASAVSEVQDKIEEAVEAKAKADAIIEALNVQIDTVLASGEIETSDELEIYAGAVKESSVLLPSPWNYAGYGLSAILTGVAGVFRRREQKAVKAVGQVVAGTKEILDEISSIQDEADAKKILKSKQSPDTRSLVDEALTGQ